MTLKIYCKKEIIFLTKNPSFLLSKFDYFSYLLKGRMNKNFSEANEGERGKCEFFVHFLCILIHKNFKRGEGEGGFNRR